MGSNLRKHSTGEAHRPRQAETGASAGQGTLAESDGREAVCEKTSQALYLIRSQIDASAAMFCPRPASPCAKGSQQQEARRASRDDG